MPRKKKPPKQMNAMANALNNKIFQPKTIGDKRPHKNAKTLRKKKLTWKTTDELLFYSFSDFHLQKTNLLHCRKIS